MSDGECLVAREVQVLSTHEDVALSDKLHGLTIEEKKDRSTHNIQPADFITLQSISSSALARKTNTTSKIGRGAQALFADLLNSNENAEVKEPVKDEKKEEVKKEVVIEAKIEAKKEVKSEEAEKENKDSEKKEAVKEQPKEEKKAEKEKKTEDAKTDDAEEEEVEGDLISRGPVRTARQVVPAPHPYMTSARAVNYGAAAQTTVSDFSAYSGYGSTYECGVPSWQDSPDNNSYISSSSTPDTVVSSDYASSISPGNSPFADPHMTQIELSRLLDANEELPSNLADFILTFSRSYPNKRQIKREEDCSYSHRPSSASDSTSGMEDSPLYAGSAPHSSPGAPHAGYTGRVSPPGLTYRTATLQNERPARLRLRAEIPQERLDPALLWVCKCIQVAPGALLYQDPDQDSLLHIVMHHSDIAKVYAIVEQQLKLDYPPDRKPFDLKNRFHETPLLIAVEMNNLLVVQYLLEAGANPNSQPLRGHRDAPLHYAATRGQIDIVKALLNDTRTQTDLKNGLGLTALHCAVRHHGVLDEATHSPINNLDVIMALIEAGSDPTCVSSSDGKTIIHYAAEKCDASLIEVLRKCVPEQTMLELVNKPDFNHEVPMDVLQLYKNKIDDKLHSTMFFALLTCGASVGKQQA